MERLTEKAEIDKCPGIWVKEGFANEGKRTWFNGYDEGYSAISKCTEYEDLEEQGMLLKLPCAVGDTVHVILPRDSHITKAQINKIEVKPTIYGKMCYFIEPVSYRGHLYRYFENDFGKTVFLTIEAAEAALKELEGKI